MHHKTKSMIMLFLILAITVGIGFTLNSFKNTSITGAVTTDTECNILCRAPIDCYDGNECTEDICVLPYDCNSRCENPVIQGCN